jgi:signal transduction histidine kinase
VLQQDEQMLASFYSQQIAAHAIKTTFTLPAAPMPLHGNPDMLSKTVMSLIGNAVYAVVKKAQKAAQASPKEVYIPEITVSSAIASHGGTKEDIVLKIRDNGIGIEEAIINKIFDPFFTTKTTDEAAGVGLYLSREIIQNHGGDITVSSVKDEYTEFTITLPKTKTS